jgi:ABC-type polysaccharide transport system permease subunit
MGYVAHVCNDYPVGFGYSFAAYFGEEMLVASLRHAAILPGSSRWHQLSPVTLDDLWALVILR